MEKGKKVWVAVLLLLGIVACEDILEVPDISNDEVTVLAPIEGANVLTNTVRFNWNPLQEATAYRVQIAEPDFENTVQILLDSTVVEDSLGLVVTQLELDMFNGSYSWRVRGENSGYETPYTTNSFTVSGEEDLDLTPPNTPQLVAPANGSAQDETEVNFSWTREDISGTAERDSIYIYSDENLQNLTTKALGANKGYTVNLTSDTYYWLVRAFDAAGNESDASSTFNFTIN